VTVGGGVAAGLTRCRICCVKVVAQLTALGGPEGAKARQAEMVLDLINVLVPSIRLDQGDAARSVSPPSAVGWGGLGCGTLCVGVDTGPKLRHCRVKASREGWVGGSGLWEYPADDS
jgi:hypothetical protein